jgi:hypothetical protein
MHDEPDTTVPEPILEQIARDHLRIPTLTTRKTDRLDFHETAVWDLREALAAAYRVGAESVAHTRTRKTHRAIAARDERSKPSKSRRPESATPSR